MGFKPIENAAVMVYRNGLYQELPLAEYDGGMYVEVSRGKYARLKADGSATLDKLRVKKMEFDGNLYRDPLGRLSVNEGDEQENHLVLGEINNGDFRAIAPPDAKKLAAP